ncbi:LysR family transcriptional regulator [Aurantiacibacter gilvus]|uniref:LysR family transcriptional regulator n=1 Tax=Aurantiacibacter gilvus TaxID=3139141 RepID=A0ABU9IGB7_9SPHN
MPTLPFTLRQLEVFASLAETRSFRVSADNLGISQASVSNQLKVLEEQLGTRLFDRKPGLRPLLTADGQAFHEDLRAFERAAAALASHRRSMADSKDQPLRFRLLVGQGMFDGYVRTKLDGFLAGHPRIELDFETVPPSSSILKTIESGRYDFAMFNLRADLPYPPQLRRLALLPGGIYGHRKFAKGLRLPLSPEQINLLPFVLPQAGSRPERELLQSIDRHGIRPRKVVGHSQYYDVMAAMLERGVAVASFSEAILPRAMRQDVIKLMPVEDWNLLLYSKPADSDPHQQAVEKFLIDSLLLDPDFPCLKTFVKAGK